MLQKISRYLRQNRGQSIVEFALTLPIFITVLFGIIEIGRLLSWQITATEAAREAVRAVSLSGSTASAATTASRFGTFTSVTVSPTTLTFGNPVTVTVRQDVRINAPIISHLIPNNPYPITATANMRVEYNN